MNYAKNYIQRMGSYKPPLEGRRNYDGLKLDFNEATMPVSPKVKEALARMVSRNEFQLYPEYEQFEGQLSEYVGIDSSQLMITNGSDQAIELIFRTFTAENDEVVIPSPSFAMFYQCANSMGNKVVEIQHETDLSFPTQAVLNSITFNTRLVVLCNPNNPTGTLISQADIENTLEKALKSDAMVYVDEAYYEFSKQTAVPLLQKYPNLIITRTFSKAFGLAALRVGYAVATEEVITEMKKVRGPYDVNMAGVIAAKAALKDRKSMENYVEEVVGSSKAFVEDFFQENDITFFPSGANFILFKPDNSELVCKNLKENGILVRPRHAKGIENTLRVSLGTLEQMKKFTRVYRQLFIKPKS